MQSFWPKIHFFCNVITFFDTIMTGHQKSKVFVLFYVKMKFEKCIYFANFFHRLKYLMYYFEASVQLVPTFYSHPVYRLLELQLILASEEDCVQLGPKYYSKVKLRSWQSPNILSEIMKLLQNGGSSINLAQISN